MRVPEVDGRRLLARLAQLAAIGADPHGGITRLAYSAEDVSARDLVAGWLIDAGLHVTVDAAASLVARAAGDGSGLGTLAAGSHLDTVVQAGHLDGAYGVVAATEAATALHEAGVRLRHPLAVLAFANEEGARGTPGMVGSLAVAGRAPDPAVPDDEGVPLGERLRAAGGDPDALAAAAWPSGLLAGYLELHIEQGPVLEDLGLRVGVVDAITGRANVEVEITGVAQHAGTTPMHLRRDALAAAARVVLAVEELARSGSVRVATAGRVEVEPGVRNTVAGLARVSLELRDVDPARLAAGLDALDGTCADIASRTGCVVAVRRGPAVPPVPTDARLLACVAEAAAGLGLPRTTMPSGAGHDAQVMAALGPVGMCFVPSRGGVSHAPQEGTDDADLVAGARVLLGALLLADARLDA